MDVLSLVTAYFFFRIVIIRQEIIQISLSGGIVIVIVVATITYVLMTDKIVSFQAMVKFIVECIYIGQVWEEISHLDPSLVIILEHFMCGSFYIISS